MAFFAAGQLILILNFFAQLMPAQTIVCSSGKISESCVVSGTQNFNTVIGVKNLVIAEGATLVCAASQSGCTLDIDETLEVYGTLESDATELHVHAQTLTVYGEGSITGLSLTLSSDVLTSIDGSVEAKGSSAEVRLVGAEIIDISGTVSAENSGVGAGGNGFIPSGASTGLFVSGGGGGHGGNGADSCGRAHDSLPLPKGGNAYGSAQEPNSFGSGGGHGCGYSSTCPYRGDGGAGGGRIFVNASS
eukprot:419434-Rhodomonas_salina.4